MCRQYYSVDRVIKMLLCNSVFFIRKCICDDSIRFSSVPNGGGVNTGL